MAPIKDCCFIDEVMENAECFQHGDESQWVEISAFDGDAAIVPIMLYDARIGPKLFAEKDDGKLVVLRHWFLLPSSSERKS